MRHEYHRTALVMLLGAGLYFAAACRTAFAADDQNFFTHIHTEKAMANVTVAPARAGPGPVVIIIQLETMDERPLPAQAVSLSLSGPQADAPMVEATCEHTSDDRWQAKLPVPSAGRWNLGLRIKLSASDEVNVMSPILIQ